MLARLGWYLPDDLCKIHIGQYNGLEWNFTIICQGGVTQCQCHPNSEVSRGQWRFLFCNHIVYPNGLSFSSFVCWFKIFHLRQKNREPKVNAYPRPTEIMSANDIGWPSWALTFPEIRGAPTGVGHTGHVPSPSASGTPSWASKAPPKTPSRAPGCHI